ncbi:MAG: DinB family protein [Thermomicrobiales bacterium]
MLGQTMMLKMFGYNAFANAKVLEIAGALSDAELDAPTNYAHGSIRGTLAHLLRVQRGWRAVVTTHETPKMPLSIDETSSIADLLAFAKDEETAINDWLAGQTDEQLAAPFNTEFQGQVFENIPWQGLSQMLFHGMQHRSEVALWLTEKGHSPGDLDFIFYTDPSMG